MGHQFPLRSARGLGLELTFANPSRQTAVRFDLTSRAQLRINREQQLSIEDLIHSRFRAVATVVLVWAVVYLPALGSIAIKGEEGRRILPAVKMLETGNYIVPQVGSNPYYRKPPLVNWLVAASFRFCGVRNEWTARLPSALCGTRRGRCVCHRRTCQPRFERIDHRRYDLADEHRHHRKRPVD